ncbi:thymidylate synthase [Haloactinospora alba]|uniref:Thymidylate synthase n=1 Tax=Haloactinospora alba TaxID=405555 RepID=A0A543NH78_9ACTN|nr:thymidylate synthase [Haloactinospora alba]TQN31159.1 thymidylate synthase [Haloactinospora alba]
MLPPEYSSFQEAYVSVLRKALEDHECRVSPRGNTSREITDTSLRISNPRARLAFLEERPVNVVFNLAEVLWYLAGRDDLNMIAYYAPRLSNFSRDGQHLTGTAYGPKLFGQARDGSSQWSRVRDLLLTDPDTKRATVTFFRPEELTDQANPDVSCTVSAQFLLRDGQLHLSVFMRGNDAYVGMVSDVFAFTFIQEFAAAQLGVQLGHYTHHVVSMHVNDRDADHVQRIIKANSNRDADTVSFPPAAMPSDASWEDITTVLQHEAGLRTNELAHCPSSVAALDLAPYWQNIILLFEIYRQIQHTTGTVSPQVLNALDPGHRWLVERRWPARMPGGTQ